MGCVKVKKWGMLTCEGMVVIKGREKVGVIGDLHIGYDSVISPSVSLPINYVEKVKKKIMALIDNYNLKRLVIDGDIQHEFSPKAYMPLKDIVRFVEFLNEISQTIDVELIRGNHDTYLHKILERHAPSLELKSYIAVQDFYIFHGHVFPDGISLETIKLNGKGTITAHQHPSINVRDEVGGGMRLDAFLVKDKHIILPSFQPFTEGTDIIGIEEEDIINVVLKEEGKDEFEVYALTPFNELLYFGRIRELERVMRRK